MARKYVFKIKERVIAVVERLHREVTMEMNVTVCWKSCLGLVTEGTWELRKKEELKLIIGTEIETF